MPRFNVTFPFDGEMTIEVDAKDTIEAIAKAKDRASLSYAGDWECDFDEHYVEPVAG